tara:strand:+ start:177404 stop:178210 length:807 start_codon:yes stop_codon:yes gene_type:complete
MFNLLALLDDIAATMDDVAIMSKVAMKKTSVLMSDDLAVNAGVVTGVHPSRELPMVKSIFLGSLLNKVYGILGVLLLSWIYPPMITAILFLGGIYLSFEGVHKIVEKLISKRKDVEVVRKLVTEKQKVQGAIRTDLILSIEIIVLAKSTLTGDFLVQLVTLSAVGIVASVIIYGLVALVVKVDDFGLYLIGRGQDKLGLCFVNSMPYIMRGLGIVGTVAMLLVGGGIIAHTFQLPEVFNEHLQNLVIGLVAGLICVGLYESKSLLIKG